MVSLTSRDQCVEWVKNSTQNVTVANLYEELDAAGFPETHQCSHYLKVNAQHSLNIAYVAATVIILLLLMHIGLFILTFIRSKEYGSWKQVPQTNYTLLLLSFLMVTGYPPMLYALIGQWTTDERGNKRCTFTYDIVLPFFMLVNFCAYNLLYLRAKAVLHARFFRHDKKVLRILQMARIVTYTIPGYMIVSILLFNGSVVPPGLCVVLTDLWVSVLFLLTDTGLSVTYLGLFLYPVIKVLWNTRQEGHLAQTHSALRGTAKRNLKWSSLVIFSSFFGLMLTTLATALAGTPDFGNFMYQPLLPLATLAIAIDRVCVTFAFYSLTNQWMPLRLQTSKRRWWLYIPLFVFRIQQAEATTSPEEPELKFSPMQSDRPNIESPNNSSSAVQEGKAFHEGNIGKPYPEPYYLNRT